MVYIERTALLGELVTAALRHPVFQARASLLPERQIRQAVEDELATKASQSPSLTLIRLPVARLVFMRLSGSPRVGAIFRGNGSLSTRRLSGHERSRQLIESKLDHALPSHRDLDELVDGHSPGSDREPSATI